jgi:hypothetical protein
MLMHGWTVPTAAPLSNRLDFRHPGLLPAPGQGSPPERSDVARAPAYLRFPTRSGWGRLAHGPGAGRLEDIEYGAAVRAPLPRPLGCCRRKDRSGARRGGLRGGQRSRTSAKLRLCRKCLSSSRRETLGKCLIRVARRGGRARLKASDSKSDRGASPSGVQILSPPPKFLSKASGETPEGRAVDARRRRVGLVGRGGRVAEGAALEMPCRGNSTVGSNPTPSAIFCSSSTWLCHVDHRQQGYVIRFRAMTRGNRSLVGAVSSCR